MQQEAAQPKKTEVTLADFEEALHPTKKTSALGKGSYGVVKLVREKENPKGPLYALKTINKKSVAEGGASSILNREIRIHQKLEHPHVIKLHYAFEDGQNLYLVLDYAEKGNLFSHLRKKKKFTEKEAFVFFFQTSLGIDYLHKKGILHRDLKPENLLLDGKGNIKVCDFGWSAESSDIRNTFCGTVDYMAPEMVDRKSHDFRVDIWSLGVLLYELIHGHEPFRAKTPSQKFKQILNNDFKINSDVSPLAKDLMQKLLRADPEQRLNFEQIFEHEWLKKHEQELKINMKKYIYDPSNRVKTNKTENIKLVSGRTKERDDSNDTLNTSLNVSVVDFEPVSLKNKLKDIKICKSENALPEPNEIYTQVSKTLIANSKSLIEIPSSPKSNSKGSRSQNMHTAGNNSILDEESKIAGENRNAVNEETSTLTHAQSKSLINANSSSNLLNQPQNEGIANNSNSNNPTIKKSKSILEEDEKMITEIQQMIQGAPLSESLSQNPSPSSKATETIEAGQEKNDAEKKITSKAKPEIKKLDLSKTRNFDFNSQNMNITPPDSTAQWNNKTIDEISPNPQVENQETNEKIRLTDLDKYFDDLLDSKDEIFQVLSKVEAVSKTSLESERLGKMRQNRFKDTESKNERSDNSDKTDKNVEFRPQNNETSRKSTTSIEMNCHQEISEIDLNFSRMDEPLSDEIKSMNGSTPPKADGKLAVERGFTFGGKRSGGSSNSKRNLSPEQQTPSLIGADQEVSRQAASKKIGNKLNILKKELMSESSEHDADDDDSEVDLTSSKSKRNDVRTLVNNANHKISEKGSEQEYSPDIIGDLKLYFKNIPGTSSGSKDILNDSTILKEMAKKTTDLQRDQLPKYNRHEMKKLRSEYDEELSRIEASVLESESPSTDTSKFSQSSRLKLKAQALAGRKRSFLEDSSPESPQVDQRSKTSKESNQDTSSTAVKNKIVDDPEQLQNWLSNRNPEKDLDLSFLPKQYVYGQKSLDNSVDILYKTAQKLDELSRKDFKHPVPKKPAQSLGFIDRVINMLTCGNKRHC